MNDNEYNNMRQSHKISLDDDKKPEKSLLMQILTKRVVNNSDEKNREGEKKEAKTPIWWAIMIFCIVYGIEIVYKAMMAAPQ